MCAQLGSKAKITGYKAVAAWLTGLLLTFSPMSHAKTEQEILKELNDLVAAERYDEAWVLSNEHVMDMGGEPNFDYLMGMAALNTNASQEAVFAFERAVIVKPKWKQARFQLARSYFQVENLAASKSELTKLKAESTDQAFIDQIDGYIGQVDNAILSKKRKFQQNIAFMVGFDDNINSGTTLDSIFLTQLGTDIPLSPDSQEIKDTSYNTTYVASYQEPLNQNSLIIGQLGIFRTDYQDSPQFERTMVDATVKFQDVLGDFTYQVGGFFRPMELNGELFRDQYGFATTWAYPLAPGWGLNWQAGFGKTNYEAGEEQDVRDVFATVATTYQTGMWQHSLSLNHTDIRAILPNTKYNSHHYYHIIYQNAYILTQTQQLTFNASYQKYNYDVKHPILGQVRDESQVSAGIGWRYMYNEWLMFSLGYQYTDKTSVDHITKNPKGTIFQYERNVFNLGVTLQF